MALQDQHAQGSQSFMDKIESLISDMLIENDISLYRMDVGMGADEGSLPAIRLVTFSDDDINKVTGLLKSEFDIQPLQAQEEGDIAFSGSKASFTAQFSAARTALTEYKKYAGRRFNVHICSMLQDAYSVMEKALGATGATQQKKEMHRIGVLLEMADSEFTRIKNALGNNISAKAKTGGNTTGQAAIYEKPAHIATAGSHENAAAAVQPAAETAADTYAAAPQEDVADSAPQAEAYNGDAAHIPNELMVMEMELAAGDLAAINVNTIENTNGHELPDMINLAESGLQQDIAPAHEEESLPAPVAAKPEAVALNIDNIETFNMHVNGMIEKGTEADMEQNAAGSSNDNSFLTMEDRYQNKKPVVIDEHAPMTQETLKEYVAFSKLIKEVDMLIAARAGATLNNEIDVEGDVDRLRFLKVYTLMQLYERIQENKDDIVNFAAKWIGNDNGGSFDSGISLFYLEYLLVGKRNDPAFAVEYVVKFISDNDYSARFIIPTYNTIRNINNSIKFSHLTTKP